MSGNAKDAEVSCMLNRTVSSKSEVKLAATHTIRTILNIMQSPLLVQDICNYKISDWSIATVPGSGAGSQKAHHKGRVRLTKMAMKSTKRLSASFTWSLCTFSYAFSMITWRVHNQAQPQHTHASISQKLATENAEGGLDQVCACQ